MIQEAVQKAVAHARAAGDGGKVQPRRLAGARDRHMRSRRPPSSPARCHKLVEVIGEGSHVHASVAACHWRCRNCRRWPGVRLGAAEVGIRYQGRTDVVMMEVAPGSTVAGVFTSNKCPGAPVDWCRGALKGAQGSAGGGERRQRQRVHRPAPGGDACAATAAAAAKLWLVARRGRCSSPPPG